MKVMLENLKTNMLNISLLHVLIGVFHPVMMAQGTVDASAYKANHSWNDPLTIPPLLSGNFGELRGNHFHTGIDLKTQGKEGFPVLAATDGRIARVRMSPWGYGNALYLEGPDGISTVYAHLQRFNPKIQSWAIEHIYEGRILGLDAAPHHSAGLTFQSGDTLGWSGNTGGSGGPHLHFEIRTTDNQHPINPLDGWLDKTDTRPPQLPTLWIETQTDLFSMSLPASDTLLLGSAVRFSVEGYDLLDGASNVCGIRFLESRIVGEQGEVLLEHNVDWSELDFAVNKDMNAHALFPIWDEKRDQVHRLHRLPTNRLGIYRRSAGDGWLDLEPGALATLEIRAVDASENQTIRTIQLKGIEDGEVGAEPWGKLRTTNVGSGVEVVPNKSGHWSEHGFDLNWKAGTFFEKESLTWEVDPSGRSARLGPENVPYRKAINVQWPMPPSLDVVGKAEGVNDQAYTWVAVLRDENGELDDVELAECSGSNWTMNLGRGGQWTMEQDLIGPKLMPYHSGTPLVSNGDAVWLVDDDFSGVETIELTFNGAWTRGVWDPKRNMFTYESSDGKHPVGVPCEVVLKAVDEVGNVSVWSRTLTWLK